MTLDLESARRDLIAMRVKHGAKSAIGMRCSNLIEQLHTLQTAFGEQQTALEKFIKEQMADLERLTGD